MANALKVISVLLSYPSADLQTAIPEIEAAVASDPRLPAVDRARLAALATDIGGLDLYDAQERYVSLFDRTRTLSLHLFEHVHGESRDRGQAMVDLAQMYDRQGFDIDPGEMPDFLPLFLEYLSTQSDQEVHDLLGQTLHIVANLRARLQKRSSIYANAMLTLEAIAGIAPDAEKLDQLLEEPDHDPDDLDALDAVWESEAVTFGGGTGENNCGPDRLRMQVRAARRPPPQPGTQGGS
jgi:nitrate reductase delta subunit